MLTGGTDVHLVLVDLRDSELDGQQGEDRLHAIGITVNRNAVPFDPRPPMVSSGLRIGTPALATRGFGDDDFSEVADIIAAALAGSGDEAAARRAARPGRDPRRQVPALPGPRRRVAADGGLMAKPLPEHPDLLWRNPDPKSSYDAIIVGAGGHGLATAYYLAKNHGITNVAVLEKGWLAGGNMARNTTIIRSNYLWDESAAIYEHSLKLWEGLPGGAGLRLPVQPARRAQPRPHAAGRPRERCAGSTPTAQRRRRRVAGRPTRWRRSARSSTSRQDIRYPVLGATFQPRAGIAKHDHVAWAFARACDELGVDLIQNCEVTGFVKDGNRVVGVETSRGRIATGKVGLAAAGHSSVLAELAGFRLPIQSHPLQALVSELYEPVHPTVVMSNHVHVYVSQAHKGELVMGAGVDSYNGYGQRGAFHVIEHQMAAAVELFPIFARAHLLRTWGGIVDVTPGRLADRRRRPRSRTCTSTAAGGPAASRRPRLPAGRSRTPSPPASRMRSTGPFALERFATGALIDEHGAAGVAH